MSGPAAGLRRRDDLLRFAGWRLNHGGRIEPALMVAAAHRAWALHDLSLAERLAQVAVEADGGFEAELLAAQMLSLTGRAEEAEQRLAELDGRAQGDAELGRLAIVRMDNLIYSLGRLDEVQADVLSRRVVGGLLDGERQRYHHLRQWPVGSRVAAGERRRAHGWEV